MAFRTQDGRMKPGVAVLLAVIGLVFLMMNLGSCPMRPPWSHHWDDRGFLITPFGPFYGLLGIWGLIQIGLAVWVGLDAHRRGSNGFLWGLLVFFTPVVGLIVYLILAPSLAQRNGATVAVPPPAAAPASIACPSCGQALQEEFKVCPYCSFSLRCKQCDQPVRSGWKVCPYCTEPL